MDILFKIIIVLFSVVIHEVSHGIMAYRLGDPTAKNAGRLTLNPIPHIDLFGSILLPVLSITLGGFIFGYAKPVPYNPLFLKDQKYGPAKVGLAGPASNILLAIAFGLLLRFMPIGLSSTALPELFSFIVLINLMLAIFNLMPVPPLDGHWFLLTFWPKRFSYLKRVYAQYGFFLFIIFLIFIFPKVIPLLNILFKLIVGV